MSPLLPCSHGLHTRPPHPRARQVSVTRTPSTTDHRSSEMDHYSETHCVTILSLSPKQPNHKGLRGPVSDFPSPCVNPLYHCYKDWL